MLLLFNFLGTLHPQSLTTVTSGPTVSLDLFFTLLIYYIYFAVLTTSCTIMVVISNHSGIENEK